MIAFMVLVFVAVALAASAFVVLPLIRRSREDDARRPLLAAGAGLGVAAMGLVFYVALGTPEVALSSLRGASTEDYPQLIATLSREMRERPGDIQGWTLLGRGYMAVGNPAEGMKAFRQAVNLRKERLGRSAHGAPVELWRGGGPGIERGHQGSRGHLPRGARSGPRRSDGPLLCRPRPIHARRPEGCASDVARRLARPRPTPNGAAHWFIR